MQAIKKYLEKVTYLGALGLLAASSILGTVSCDKEPKVNVYADNTHFEIDAKFADRCKLVDGQDLQALVDKYKIGSLLNDGTGIEGPGVVGYINRDEIQDMVICTEDWNLPYSNRNSLYFIEIINGVAKIENSYTNPDIPGSRILLKDFGNNGDGEWFIANMWAGDPVIYVLDGKDEINVSEVLSVNEKDVPFCWAHSSPSYKILNPEEHGIDGILFRISYDGMRICDDGILLCAYDNDFGFSGIGNYYMSAGDKLTHQYFRIA